MPTNNTIGKADSVNQFLYACLAGVGYWSKALSTAEMAVLYNNGLGLLGTELSGSLLTSLGSYYDFADANSLGTDSSGNGHTMTNTGNVTWNGNGPSGAFYQVNNAFRGRPPFVTTSTPWKSGLVSAISFQNESGSKVSAHDVATGGVRVFQGAPTWSKGSWGTDLQISDSAQGGPGFGIPLQGKTEFTLTALCTATITTGGGSGLRQLWCEDTSTANVRIGFNNGILFFQLGAD